MRIFGWAADNAGPGWYRLRVPLGELNKHGYETLVDTTMPEEWLETADVIVGSRVCQPGSTKRWRRLAEGAYGRRPMLVFDIDDDLWDIDPANKPAWEFFGRNSPLLDNLRESARLADFCTVSTEPLYDIVSKINPNTVMLPNRLPASAFLEPPLDRTNRPFTVGWSGGASHLADVDEVTPALRQFYRRNPGAIFHNVGTLFESVARAAGSSLSHTPWSEDVPSYYSALDFHVGLAPLRPSLFNRSKSALKFMEYCARGIVTIASDHGPYAAELRRAGLGYLVSRPHEWASILSGLHRSPPILADDSRQALAYAQSCRIEQHWQDWETLYLN